MERVREERLIAGQEQRMACRPRVHGAQRYVRMAVFLLAFACTATGVDALSGSPANRNQACVRASLQGDVFEGKSWSAALGEGWILQLLPISDAAYASGHRYSGWDLAVNRADAQAYPDGLLLATVPYGSLNAREIGTTYGMRAQDAIAWEPRHFRFLTSAADLTRARGLYARVMPRREVGDSERNEASTQLLGLLRAAQQGSGQLRVDDARLIAGTADPPAFAQAWTQHLEAVRHTYEQSGVGSSQGELRWMRFSIALWLPQGWRVPAPWHAVRAKCAE